MDVRASDAERDAVIEQLREAAAEGRLTMEELTDRIEAAANAVMRSELERLTGDLPATGGAVSAPVLDERESALGDVKRSGAWLVPQYTELRSNPRLGKLKRQDSAATPGAPKVILTGGTMFGTIKVRHKRLWEKLFGA